MEDNTVLSLLSVLENLYKVALPLTLVWAIVEVRRRKKKKVWPEENDSEYNDL